MHTIRHRSLCAVPCRAVGGDVQAVDYTWCDYDMGVAGGGHYRHSMCVSLTLSVTLTWQVVDYWGGVDILINNASALWW